MRLLLASVVVPVLATGCAGVSIVAPELQDEREIDLAILQAHHKPGFPLLASKDHARQGTPASIETDGPIEFDFPPDLAQPLTPDLEASCWYFRRGHHWFDPPCSGGRIRFARPQFGPGRETATVYFELFPRGCVATLRRDHGRWILIEERELWIE